MLSKRHHHLSTWIRLKSPVLKKPVMIEKAVITKRSELTDKDP